MKGFVFFALIVCLFSCKEKHQSYNPKAIKLNDSAIMMGEAMRSNQLKNPVEKDSLAKVQLFLLNQATNIDSNYFLGYWNKFSIQYTSKQYSNALVTGKEMIRLHPKDAMVRYLVGKIYDKTGDPIQARSYYEYYLNECNRLLDTMSPNNKQLKPIEFQKASVLILLNQQQKGHDILNKLYQEADSLDKGRYLLYMHLTKADLLVAKDTSITIGKRTTYINTFFP